MSTYIGPLLLLGFIGMAGYLVGSLLNDWREKRWADVESEVYGAGRGRTSEGQRYTIGTDRSGEGVRAYQVTMTWREVSELAAQKSKLGSVKEAYVSRRDGGVVKTWVWRRGVLVNHSTRDPGGPGA